MLRKILSLTLSFSLFFQYCGFAQTINLADYLSKAPNTLALDRFRPLSLRYFSYEPAVDSFKILLDKGDQKNLSDTKIKDEADKLLTYFKIGLTLPNEKFWVNLRPDSEDQIIDPELEKTDLGKALLEADLQLKKDTSSLTSPQTKEGKAYWDKLYQRAGELFGTENITIPTLTRPWIVPGEIILRESTDNISKSAQGAYIYKANLKVMLEEDYLKTSNQKPVTGNQIYSFSDPRLKELNQYSTQLIRELILPKLTQKVNSSKDYANLRQVYFSLILARWFKEKYQGLSVGNGLKPFPTLDSGDLTNLTSKQAWDKTTYFNAYQKSFQEGEYNLSEPLYTHTGQVIRRYMSGGMRTMPTAEQVNNKFTAKEDIVASPAEYKGKVLLNDKLIIKKLTAEVPVELTTPKMAASAIVAGEEKANFTKSLTDLAGSPAENRIGFVYQELPQNRIEQVEALLQQIDKEKSNPWPSLLPGTFAFSDFHGDEKRLRQLLSYKLYQLLGFQGLLEPNVSVEKQLNEQNLSLKNINGSVVFGGDYPDRGPYGLKCFFIAKEVIESAPDRNVNLAGNHDVWAEGNLSGYHLPVRKNFNFYGDKQAEGLIAIERKKHPEYFNSQKGLLWWAVRLAEYNEYQESFQKDFTFKDGKKAEGVRKEFLEYYKAYESRWNDAQAHTMRNFIGHFPHIDVPDPYLGLNGIGKTSAKWWEILYAELKADYEARKTSGADNKELKTWESAIGCAEQVKGEVKKRFDNAVSQDQWWYRIFESINTQAYKSPEWWFSNWSIRKDWGGFIFNELNEMLADPNIEHPLIKADREVFEGVKVSQKNYHKSKTLQAFAEFIRKNANLYFRNPYRVLLSHSYFPVEDNGQIVIKYKERTYTDENVYDGLKAISADYKRSTGGFEEEIGEPRVLLNSWYADETTRLKPRDEKRYRDVIGIEKIQSRIKANYWGTGHNPANKLKVPFVVKDKNNPEFVHFHIDFFMAEKYGGNGATVSIGPGGISMSGFRHKDDNSVRPSPQTVIPGKEGKPAEVIENPGISREEFLKHTERILSEELLDLVQQVELDAKGCETLARIAAFAPRGLKQALYEKIVLKAKEKGIWLDSPQKVYEAVRNRQIKGTIPAINIRGLTYDTARAVFRAAKKNNSGTFILELARSEIGYTDQRPSEYSAVILSAAMAEGYKGPVFIQLDHCQINAKKYQADKEKEINTVDDLIKEAVAAGFYSIDIDTSTLVDLDKNDLTEQQRLNFEWAAQLTAYIRSLQPKGINIAVGGEIGEVGKKNSTVEELKAFMNGYNQELAKKGEGLKGISKISVQTGTSHGGVPLPDGSVAQVKLDFDTLKDLSAAARDIYGLAGAVQHGASTLPPEAFDNFPRVETAEVHLATEFQNMIYENPGFPADFKVEIYDFLNNHPEIKKERKPEETDAQFLYKVRKNGFGPFKERFWNLPESVRGKIGNDLEVKFDFLFKKLSAGDTVQWVSNNYVSSSLQSGFDNTPYPNFADTQAVYNALRGAVEFDASGKAIKIVDEEKLRGQVIDSLAYDAVFNPNPEVLKLTRRVIRETGKLMGIVPQSIYGLYSQKSQDPRNYTVPALNIRGLGYDSAAALYKAAKKLGITYIISEIARSEIGYTGQRPEEYVIVNLAGAIKAGYKKAVYIQADHFQIAPTAYSGNPQKAVEDLKDLLKEALLAGFGQVDLDMSTMVDWSKDDVSDYDGMQKLNYILSAYFTLYTRYLEKAYNLETVNLGAEIGEVGKGIKGRDSSLKDYYAFMKGYNRWLVMFKEGKGYESEENIPDFIKKDIKEMRDYLFGSDNSLEYDLVGISKEAVQAGTAHGLGGKANFKVLAQIGKAARKDGLAGVVFHGASKTDLKYFPLYAGKDVEGAIESGVVDPNLEEAKQIVKMLADNSVAEVHLATEFQDVILNTIEKINPGVYLQIEAYIKETLTKAGKWPQKEEDRKKALRDKDNRKNVFGPLKAAMHNLSSQEKEQIRAALENRFVDFLSPLGVAGISDTWSQQLSQELMLLPYGQEFFRQVQMEKHLFGGNWKERKDITSEEQARAKAKEFRKKFETLSSEINEKAQIIIFPEAKWAKVIAEELKGSNISVGLQSLFFNPDGDLQQQINEAVMMGVAYVNIGHSMHRRKGKGLTDQQANKIMKAILKDKRLIPWYAIEESGEKDSQEEIKSAVEVGLKDIPSEVISYFPITLEPTVLISTKDGSGKVDPNLKVSGEDAYKRVTATREAIDRYFGKVDVNVGYGASVKSSNSQEIFAQKNVKNALIGGASLEADEFFNLVVNAMKGVDSIASSAIMETVAVEKTSGNVLGGIDFRQMNMLIQPQGSFASSSLDFSLPALSKAEIEAFDLDKELEVIQRMASSGIDPIDERLKKYLSVCFARGKVGKEIDELKLCLEDVFTAQQLDARETPDGYKEVIVIADTRRFVVKESLLAAGRSNATSLN